MSITQDSREVVAGQLLSRGQKITPTEERFLTYMCQGYKTKAIAHAMGVSIRTLETHRQRIMYKTSSENLVQLGVWAMRNGKFS